MQGNDLQDQLAAIEAEQAALEAELAVFEAEYTRSVVGVLAELHAVQARLAAIAGEPAAAQILDGKVLDAQVQDDSVGFAILDSPA